MNKKIAFTVASVIILLASVFGLWLPAAPNATAAPTQINSVCGSDPAQVGCWLFDEGSGTTTADGSGNGNNGTLNDSTMWTTDRFGKVNKALHFSGSQYVRVADSNSLDITGDITIAAWVDPGTVATQDIIKKAVMNSVDGYEMAGSSATGNCITPADPACYFSRFNQYSNQSTPEKYRIDTLYNYAGADTWTHLAVTYTGVDNTLRFYVNGTLDNSRIPSSPLIIAANTLPLSFGAQLTAAGVASRFFNGSLDDVRLYKRSLSASEIKALYNDTIPSGFTCTAIQSRAGTANTEHKPMSKVWNYENKWWSVFPASSGVSPAGAWLWRLDGTPLSPVWTPILNLSTNTSAKADVKPAGSPVGSVVHILLYNGANTALASVEYNAGIYQQWSGRPGGLSTISLPNSETATIDIDSGGRMWLATENDSTNEIVVFHSVSPYSTWGGPIALATGVGSVNDDDISVVTALPNNTIGVLWSNQATKRFGFKYHKDTDPETTWSADEVPASQSANDTDGAGMADDHLNVAVSFDGTLYAAVKTGYDTTGLPKIAMLVRRLSGSTGAGVWDNLYGVSESGTRGIVLLDDTAGVITLIYTAVENGGDILYKQTSILQPISFGSVRTMRSGTNNDVSSTKQNINGELVTIYSNGTTINGSLCNTAPSGGVDLSITKTDNKTAALPGDASSYTIVVSNSSASPVTGVTVADTFPLSLTGIAWTCSAGSGSSCTASGSGNINDTIALAASGSVTYIVNTTISSSATGVIANTAAVTPPSGVSDPNTSNNTATDYTVLRSGLSLCGNDPDLVACYQLDEGSGNVYLDGVQNTIYNDGVTVGDPSWPAGISGTALNFNGTTQYGYAPDDNTLDIVNQITLAAWIKPENVATQDLIKKVSGTTGFELTLSTTSGLSPYKAFVRFNGSDTYRVSTTTNYCDNTTDCSVNTWKHLAATYDGATIKIYVNGQLENFLTTTFTITPNTAPLSLGAFYTGSSASRYYDGTIDDVRVYDRALTATEIMALYSGNTPPNQPTMIIPPNGQTNVGVPATLSVNVSDPESDPLNVCFFGRPAPTTPDFTFVVLPDSQNYIASLNNGTPAMFTDQMIWIVNNRIGENVAFATHVGDLVNTGATESEWQTADAAYDILEGSNPNLIPFGIALGNHDMNVYNVPTGTQFYNQYFGIARFNGRSYYQGAYVDPTNTPTPDNDNNYEFFSVGGLDFIVIHLENNDNPPAAVLNWADGLLASNPTRRGIVVFHTLFDTTSGCTSPLSPAGDTIYSALSDRPNLFLMIGGHLSGENYCSLTRSGMNPVSAMLVDYQSRTNGGNGWMRLLQFSPAANKIYAQTYSPTLKQYETDANSQFAIDYDMGGSSFFAQIGACQPVPSGGTASMSYPGLSLNTQYEWYVTIDDSNHVTTSPTYDFLTGDGTAVTLVDFTATPIDQWVKIEFSTTNEIDLQGFNIYRAEALDGVQTKINPSLILAQSPGLMVGNYYQFDDLGTQAGNTYYYWVEMVYSNSTQTVGPVSTFVGYLFKIWLPLISR